MRVNWHICFINVANNLLQLPIIYEWTTLVGKLVKTIHFQIIQAIYRPIHNNNKVRK